MSHVHIQFLRQMKNMLHIGIYYNELLLQRMVKKISFSKNADSYLDAFIVNAQKKLPNFCWKICDEAENYTCCDKVGKKWNLILWAVCLREPVRGNKNCCCCTNRRGDNFSWMTRYRILIYSYSYYLWHYCAFFSQLCANYVSKCMIVLILHR